MDYFIRHKFKEEIIVPYVAVYPNVGITKADSAQCTFKCGTTAEIVSVEEKHICELESEIKAIYGLDAWSYIKKWYNFDKSMQSMYFLKIKSKKI